MTLFYKILFRRASEKLNIDFDVSINNETARGAKTKQSAGIDTQARGATDLTVIACVDCTSYV